MIKKYRKLPVVIEAVQWSGFNGVEIKDFAGDCVEFNMIRDSDAENHIPPQFELFINTLEGKMEASLGDYIIKGVNNEFYACKPDVFFKTYEEVE